MTRPPARRGAAKPAPRSKTKARSEDFDKGAFFRLCRLLHVYLSAFAFLALIFFCATGVLLNHPEWFDGYRPAEHAVTVTLARADLAAAKAAKEPGRILAAAVAARTPLRGSYASGDLADGEALIRMEGPKGTSDIDVNLANGRTQVRIGTANFAAVVQDLHRGKNSGAPWRMVIDISAWLIMALSVIGYVLVFSLRFRLRTSLVLTVVSLAVLAGVAALLVP